MTTFGLKRRPQQWLKAVIGAAVALAMVPAQGRCDSYSIFCVLIELAKPQKPHHDCCCHDDYCDHEDCCCDDDCWAQDDGCTHSPCCPQGVCTGARTMPCCPKPCAGCDKACAAPDKPCAGCDKKCCENCATCPICQGISKENCTPCKPTHANTCCPVPVQGACGQVYSCPFMSGIAPAGTIKEGCKACQENSSSCSGCTLCRGNKPVHGESTTGCQATLEKQAQELRRLCGEHQRTIQELEAIVMELCQEISLLRQDIQSFRHEERAARFVFHHDERLRFAPPYMVQPEESISPASYRGFWIREEAIAMPPNGGSFMPGVQFRWAVPPPPMVVYPQAVPATSVPTRSVDD